MKLLKQDPADVSSALLLMIAQSQRRVELSIGLETIGPVEVPQFSPPRLAIAVNCLWFISLALSLIAALSAMLAKEWLKHYREYPSSTGPQFHVFVNEGRMAGMGRWKGLEIIDLLPTILHFALFVFAAGLVAYLWIFNAVLGAITLGISGMASVIYITMVFLAATFEDCPFVTRTSRYLRPYLHHCLQGFSRTVKYQFEFGQKGTQQGISRVLQRLQEEAKDPVISDSAMQALSGWQAHWSLKAPDVAEGGTSTTFKPIEFRLPLLTDIAGAGLGDRHDPRVFLGSLWRNNNSGDALYDNHQSVRLVRIICRKLTEVTLSPHRVTSGGGENVGRYARALSNLCTYIVGSHGSWADWTMENTVSQV